MEVYASNKELRKAVEDDAFCRRRYGADMAKKIQLRVAALRAAVSLGDFWPPKSGPERCHELKGDLSGIFSIDVKQPYRILFKPVEQEGPKDRADEQERWKKITAIELLEIKDTHE